MCILHTGFAQKKNKHIKNTDTIAMIQKSIATAEPSVGYTNSPAADINTQLDLYKKNVFFYGFSPENRWKLFIKEDSNFTFVYDNDTMIFQYSKPNQAQDGSVIRYYSKTELNVASNDTIKATITIAISDHGDVPENAPKDYPFKLYIIISDQAEKSSAHYIGDGFYVVNPILNDIWVLDSLNKKPVQKELFPTEFPRIEFHLNGNKIYGFGGCNEFNGSFYAAQHQIHFKNVVSTLKMCPNMTGEKIFMPLLTNKRYTYSIQNLRLKLTSRDGTVLVFKKVD